MRVYRLFPNISQVFLSVLCFAVMFFSSVAYAASVATQVQRINTPQTEVVTYPTSTIDPSLSVSADGRYTAYISGINLITADLNNKADAYVYDQQSGSLERVSIASDGTEGNNDTVAATITNDGRYIAMRSSADTLATGGATPDFLYLYDRQAHTMRYLADTVSDTPVIAGAGRYIAFTSASPTIVAGDTNAVADVFVYDTQTDTIERVSVATAGTQANAASYTPSISSDGRYVVFASDATNIVSGDTNGFTDIFVRDRQLQTTERVSVASDGTQGNWIAGENPKISDDGRYVAFISDASNLVDGDTNNRADTFVYDRQTDAVTRVSAADDGTQANEYSFFPSISSDGHYVAFNTAATNVVPNDTNGVSDLFVYNQITHDINRISTTAAGVEGNGYSFGFISGDGNSAAYESQATNLVADDTDNVPDEFLAQLSYPGPSISSVAATAASTTATITWETDVPASGVVSYGLTTSYGNTATGTDTVSSHTVALSGLTACTVYHYTVTSVSDAISTTSGDTTFTTTGCQSSGGGGGHSSGGSHHTSSSSNTDTTPADPVPTIPPPITDTACTATLTLMPAATLTKGMTNNSVGLAQRFLHDYGYYTASIDNNFGPKTEAAIKAFQLAQNLPVTGIWDATLGHAADTIIQCKTQQPLPTPPTLPIPSATAYTFSRDLHSGMTDPDVLKLQQYLNTHGVIITASGPGAPGKETTYFGALTKQALIKFQQVHHIVPASGFFGPITRQYVNTQ